MTNPRQYLESLGKPFVTLPDCAQAMGVSYHALYFRLRDVPADQKPENNHAFKAGAAWTFITDAGIAWCEKHLAFWEAKQQAKGRAA